MSHIGTFGSFGQARLAIYAAQLGLSVTGNNIANVNTVGYTRQRLDQISFKTGGADRYQSATDLRVGNGVLPTSISQLRDPYLDIRFRNENANVGAMDTKLNGLDNIAAILDEVGKGGEVPEGEQFGIIAYQLGNVFQALQRLEGETGQKEYDVQVRSAVSSLCQFFNSYATQLEKLYSNTVESYGKNVTAINNLLTNIRDLNSAIRECDIHGDKALELRDQRNNLIDELSGYMKIKVTYDVEDLGAGKTVEKLIIRLDNANPDTSVHTDESLLVDGRFCTQLKTQKPVMNADGIYMKEGGGYTSDPELAKTAARVNPAHANDPTALPYLDADNQPVATEAEAAQDPVLRAGNSYMKEGGGVTDNPALAMTAARLNPNYDPTQPEAGLNLKYLAADGTPVVDEAHAAQDPVPDNTYFKYVKADGTYTNDPAEAATTPKPNPNFAAGNGSYQYLDEDGKPTNNLNPNLVLNTDPATMVEKPYIDENGDPTDGKPAMLVPAENPNYLDYLTEDGVPTAEEDKAEMLDLENFGLQLTELRDINDRLLYTVTKMEERQLNPGETFNKDGLSVLLPDGTTKITTYRSVQQWVLKKNDGSDGNPILVDDDGNPYKYISAQKGENGEALGTNNYKAAARESTTVYYATDYIKTPSTKVDLDDNDLLGSLQAQRELLTENGEFSSKDIINNVDEKAATKRGIPYFQNILDLLANQIATAFNDANRGYLTDKNGSYIQEQTDPITGEVTGQPITFETNTQATDEDGNPMVDEKGDPVMETYTLTAGVAWEDIPQEVRDQMTANDATIDSVEAYLERGGLDADGNPAPVGIFSGGNLFSVNGNSNEDTTEDGKPITARNISVSAAWSEGPMIVNAFVCAPTKTGPESTDSSNVLKLQGLQYAKLDYLPQTFFEDAQSKAMFTGTFEEMWTNIGTILGHDQKTTSTLLDNYYEETVELDSNRSNVSSVDFNDEAANLMQYAKSYNAACRLMTTLDSVLDKLINGTGMTT